MGTFKEIAAIVCVSFMAALAVTAISVAVINPIDKIFCGKKAEAIGLQYEHGLFKGCIVETESGKIPLRNLRAIK